MTRISATGTDRRRQLGFSLVELTVVLAVIGLLGATVMMTLPTDQRRAVEQAERLASHLQHARDEAVLANRPVAVRVDAAGYRFEQLRQGDWQVLGERPFNAREFAAGVVPDFGGRDAFARFEFDATGGSIPAGLVLQAERQRVRLTLDGAGQVAVHASPH